MHHKNGNKDYFLVCFFLIENDNTLSLSHFFFEIKNISISQSTKYNYGYIDNINDIKQIQVISNSEKNKVLVCLHFIDENLECNGFNYPGGFFGDSGHFYQNFVTNFNCRNELYGIKLSYLIDNQTIAVSCINNVSLVQTIFFNNELESITSHEQFTNCTSIYGHSIIYSKIHSDYFIISDAICNNIKRSFEPLIGSLSPIQISDNENLSDEKEETDIEVPTFEKVSTEIEVSKEEIITETSKSSLIDGSKYYYPKNIDLKTDSSYVNCCSIPEGNYLNKNDSLQIIESCYPSCKICEKRGNIIYHNCIECREKYKYQLNTSNYLNCYIDNKIQNFINKSEIEEVKKILLNNFERLDTKPGEDIEVQVENAIIILTTTKNQKNNLYKNKTTINLGKCEDKLKQVNNISYNNSLYILKYDIIEEGMKIPKIEYEVYNKLSNNEIIKLN